MKDKQNLNNEIPLCAVKSCVVNVMLQGTEFNLLPQSHKHDEITLGITSTPLVKSMFQIIQLHSNQIYIITLINEWPPESI